ncbi:type II toxin-antitoxin system toxin DNA ADP-ribosyl transferase DarT [Methylorubrum extorquens]
MHVDRLASIVADGRLWCDARIVRNAKPGTTIGMGSIKTRRLTLPLDSRPGLHVGDCVPFYFCPRSIMLYIIYMANAAELAYRGGQRPIVHLECDLGEAIEWAENNDRRWAFTLSNAGAYYFEDRADKNSFNEINWDAVSTNKWSGNGVSRSVKEGKQAEFLVERSFPWALVRRIGVISKEIGLQVSQNIEGHINRPVIDLRRDWYY